MQGKRTPPPILAMHILYVLQHVHMLPMIYHKSCLVGWTTTFPNTILQNIPTFQNTAATSLSSSISNVMSSIQQPSLANSTKAQPTAANAYPLELPPKLIKKILDLEYIDMAELLPDCWDTEEDSTSCCSHSRRSSRKRPITNILTWLECYSALVSILATRYPLHTGQFMAYQRTIVKAHRSFVSEGWITYDSCYRQKAANIKSLEWGKVDFNLYNETFIGRAKALPRCAHCSSELHSSTACPDVPNSADTRPGGPPRKTRHMTEHSGSVCGLFDSRRGNQCTYASYCKFPHLCAICSGRHPQTRCPHSKGNM